ncbi:MAG: queuosine salvage family protein [bacterium]
MYNVLKTAKLVVDNSKSVTINIQTVVTSSYRLNFQRIKSWFRSDFINLKMFTKQEKINFIYIVQAVFFTYWGIQAFTFTYGDYYWDAGYTFVTLFIRILSERQSIFDRKFLISFVRDEAQYLLSWNLPMPFYTDNMYIFKEIGFVFLSRFDGTFINILKKTDMDPVGIFCFVFKSLLITLREYFKGKIFCHK